MSASAVPAPSNQEPRALIAPVWHTAVYLAGLLALSLASARFGSVLRSSRLVMYAFIIAAEWILAAFVVWGVRLRGGSLRSLVADKWPRGRDLLRDLGIAILFLIGSIAITSSLSAALGARPNARVLEMLPHTRSELLVWMFVALSAGICEELTTRGYLQRQMSGLLRSRAAGLLVQGAVFGAAHAYQGWKPVVTITLLGWMLGALAQWRGSTVPGMMSHFLQDALGGLLRGGH